MNRLIIYSFTIFLFHGNKTFAQQNKEMDEMWGEVRVRKNADTATNTNARWFRDAKYAMFIHWGLFSQNANRWKGKTYYGIGEWIMYLAKSPIGEYEQIAKDFNPVHFDARQWVQLAKDAGMKYIVITAKHHDGFAMFKSAHPYNVVQATPFNRDPMQELAVACREAGIKLGFYYSQFQDWHEINDWSPDLKKASFEEYFNQKCEPQVKELLTNYGPVTLIWFDTPGDMTREQSQALVNLVKVHQPQALINSRIGNGVGDYSTYGDHEIPVRNVSGLWEAVNTSNDSWGYAWYDKNWKGPTEIARDLISVVARGGNFMLNIGPKADGTVPAVNAGFLRTAGNWIKKNEDAIYGTGPSPWLHALPWGDATVTGNRLNLFVFSWQPGGRLWVPGLQAKIGTVISKSTGEKLRFKQEQDGWTSIELPLRTRKELIEVVTVTLTKAPRVTSVLGVDPEHTSEFPAEFAAVNGCRLSKASWMEKFGEWKHKPTIDNWHSDSSSATWTVHVKKPGMYFVDIEYNAWKEADASEWDLMIPGMDTLRVYTTETTGASKDKINAADLRERSRPRFRNVRTGIIAFDKPGEQKLVWKPAAKPHGGGIQLHALHLTPVE